MTASINPQQPKTSVNLVQARNSLKITQQDMAIKLGVSRLTYINLEKDPMLIKLGLWLKIAETLGLDPSNMNFKSYTRRECPTCNGTGFIYE